jgi:phage gp16-like protein
MNHIAAIHVIKKQLNLSDDDYRFHLRKATGKDSCKAMSPIELAQARQHFDLMANRTGLPQAKAIAATAKSKHPKRPTPSPDHLPLVKRIRAQLISLGRMPDSYADGIAKQMLGADCPQFYEWCHPTDLTKITQALGFQQRREGAATK